MNKKPYISKSTIPIELESTLSDGESPKQGLLGIRPGFILILCHYFCNTHHYYNKFPIMHTTLNAIYSSRSNNYGIATDHCVSRTLPLWYWHVKTHEEKIKLQLNTPAHTKKACYTIVNDNSVVFFSLPARTICIEVSKEIFIHVKYVRYAGDKVLYKIAMVKCIGTRNWIPQSRVDIR